ncbi:hypothetical protein [Paenibacillus durus]|uniref:Uncharacterized protein n=1 Tax=Paenibacillus durus TaxID=44251 RepID=A0A089HTF2_PAEDU|nr:hypothetical protein [Paenibacillus durus]AIQ13648.1 hypothetical protein PDUR_18295 [Paenibacillus durus]
MKTIVSYLRSGKKGRVSLTLEGAGAQQRALVSWSTFIVTFPHVSLRSMTGEIPATPAQLRKLGFNVVDITPIAPEAFTEQVVYSPGPYGHFVVSLFETKQELVINPRAFRRITGVSDRAYMGSVCVTREQAADIGFIFPPVETEEPTHALAI